MTTNVTEPVRPLWTRFGRRRASSVLAPVAIDATFEGEPLERWVWVGEGTSSRYVDGAWHRTPHQDYGFLVHQERFEGRWRSHKVQNRTHPSYDGRAGAADQQHAFVIAFGAPEPDGRLPIRLRSSYGDGAGHSDPEFRHAVLEFRPAGVSRFAPYDRFRITQHYRYADGRLDETVELFKLGRDGREQPFARIEERARLFRPSP